MVGMVKMEVKLWQVANKSIRNNGGILSMDYRMKGIQLNTGLNIGGDSPIRVNCNIGCNTLSGYNQEKEKLLTLREEGVLPDMMMD